MVIVNGGVIQRLIYSTLVNGRMIQGLNHMNICLAGVIQFIFGMYSPVKSSSTIVLLIKLGAKLLFATASAIIFSAESLFTRVLTILFCA